MVLDFRAIIKILVLVSHGYIVIWSFGSAIRYGTPWYSTGPDKYGACGPKRNDYGSGGDENLRNKKILATKLVRMMSTHRASGAGNTAVMQRERAGDMIDEDLLAVALSTGSAFDY